jgi:hypothetical protein
LKKDVLYREYDLPFRIAGNSRLYVRVFSLMDHTWTLGLAYLVEVLSASQKVSGSIPDEFIEFFQFT